MICLHAGYPKAASSTIQRFLWTNAEVLARHRLIYPDLLEPGDARRGAFRRSHNVLALELRRGAPGPSWGKLKSVAEAREPGNDIVLSGENFVSIAPALIRAALSDEPVRIVFYIRSFAKTIVSLYSQHTKTGGNTDDFDRFFAAKMERTYLNFAEHFAPWRNVFGGGNISVRLLDSRVLAGGDVRLDILEAAGLPPDHIDVSTLRMTEDENISPGWKTLEILRDLNRTLVARYARGAAIGAARRARREGKASPLVEFMVFLSGPARHAGIGQGFTERGNYLTEAQFRDCAERFAVQINRLREMGLDTRLTQAPREEFVGRTFLPSMERIPADEVAAFLRELMPAVVSTYLKRTTGSAEPETDEAD